MRHAKLTLPYSLVRQAAADLSLGSSYANSTYFDEVVLERVEQVLKNILGTVLGAHIVIEFVESVDNTPTAKDVF